MSNEKSGFFEGLVVALLGLWFACVADRRVALDVTVLLLAGTGKQPP